MRTKLLFSFLFATSLTAFSQTFTSENFDGLTIGNVSEDLTGATAGQGGLYIYGTNGDAPSTTTNSAATNFQVVASGYNGTQGVQFTTPNGNGGINYLFDVIATDWTSRTVGNDIVEVEFDFYTGSTTSLAPFRASVFADSAGSTYEAVAVEFDPSTMVLSGVANLSVNGVVGLYALSLGANNSDLVLPANTWLTIGMSYNSVTGELRWKSNYNNVNVSFGDAANVITGMVPGEFDFYSFGVDLNTVAASYVIDNYSVRATATDQLLGLDDVAELELSSVFVYPNPAKESITLSTDVSVRSVEIYNNLGQVVLQKNSNFSNTNTFDISNLTSGVYIMTINSTDGASQTKRFIKE